MYEVTEHRLPDICAHPLPNPGHEVESDKSSRSEQHHHGTQHQQAVGETSLRTCFETLINHQAQTLTDRQRNARRGHQRNACDYHTAEIRA